MRLPSIPVRRQPVRAAKAPGRTQPDPDLVAQRDRLVERFAVMQSELGGLFYEMAIRDHVRMNILIQKAAELQRVEAELRELQPFVGPTSEAGAA